MDFLLILRFYFTPRSVFTTLSNAYDRMIEPFAETADGLKRFHQSRFTGYKISLCCPMFQHNQKTLGPRFQVTLPRQNRNILMTPFQDFI